MLKAFKNGYWLLLDELNLANQEVLEGLNSLLDHRAQLFVPELNKTYSRPCNFRLFGCQNPFSQGSDRKGLPKSFLNRFTKVYIETMEPTDFKTIINLNAQNITNLNIDKMVQFITEINDYIKNKKSSSVTAMSPWDINLRDMFKWLTLIQNDINMRDCVYYLFFQRFRTGEDRQFVKDLFLKIFEIELKSPDQSIIINSHNLIIGNIKTKRIVNQFKLLNNLFLKNQKEIYSPLAAAIQLKWPICLIGSHATGKTSIIRNLAKMYGKTLVEIALTEGTDSSDFLGAFEQLDINFKLKKVILNIYNNIV